ncbi:hypothetical protein DNI29_22315 [Hymenobacter sediminis]|uniref:hypothetical protein n=1 Tax=Hymenobacter sediminis TaxID=2218621 RepID=UPI000DA6954C|nr:hypothetical protein [Hymenobacter sediminis]RPD44133.1 hypothetical protein DNI29_22315 [Hymenobacter sediminis]
MIHAIRNNKAGRNFRDQVDWRSLFGASEDSLTSSVFGHLFYLPPTLLWQLLKEAAHYFKLPEGEQTPVVTSYEFWPRWNALNTRNVYTVEPDVFVRTAAFDLIVEAKRYDYNQQDSQQWRDQLQAYVNEYAEEGEGRPEETKKPVLLLAMGGIYLGDEQPTLIECSGRLAIVYKCRWLNLLTTIQLLRQQLEPGQEHLGNILTDIIHSFGVHGYVTRSLLSTLPAPYYLLSQQLGLTLLSGTTYQWPSSSILSPLS